ATTAASAGAGRRADPRCARARGLHRLRADPARPGLHDADREDVRAGADDPYLGHRQEGGAMKDSILTRHPAGKSGRSISREKYELVRSAILEALKRGELSHSELMTRLEARLRKGLGAPGDRAHEGEACEVPARRARLTGSLGVGEAAAGERVSPSRPPLHT